VQLNQFYTESKFGDILVQKLSLSSPNNALDLGFGAGNLLHAAKRRWGHLNLIGIDIDKKNVIDAKSKSLIEALELNGFEPSLPDVINDQFGDIDLLVSNPPYFSRELDDGSKQILNSIGMLDCISSKLKKIPAELIFLAQNLRLLSRAGELGIIMPAGIVSGENWKPVREFLFSNYSVTNVIQLPTNSFKKTDAQTFILTVKHKSHLNESIPLSHINERTILSIQQQDAVVRADYTYHKGRALLTCGNDISINDFSLYRGNRSHNQLTEVTDMHLHTTNMPDHAVKKGVANAAIKGAKNTQPGDILVARVGRRCLGRVIFIDKGSVPISDCIIGIRPKTTQIGKMIWERISSSHCKNYLASVSLGVGAKYITHKIIKDYLVGNDDAVTF